MYPGLFNLWSAQLALLPEKSILSAIFAYPDAASLNFNTVFMTHAHTALPPNF